MYLMLNSRSGIGGWALGIDIEAVAKGRRLLEVP